MSFTEKKGSEKAVFRRCLERPLEEYAPLGVRPSMTHGFLDPFAFPEKETKSGWKEQARFFSHAFA